MLTDLMKYGYVKVDGEVKGILLLDMALELKHKGHALHYSQEVQDGKVVSTSVYHYRSCIVCQPTRGLPQ
jgi:hypothetical protein